MGASEHAVKGIIHYAKSSGGGHTGHEVTGEEVSTLGVPEAASKGAGGRRPFGELGRRPSVQSYAVADPPEEVF